MKKSQIFTLLLSTALIASCGKSSSTSEPAPTSVVPEIEPIDITKLDETGTMDTWAEVQAAIYGWCDYKEINHLDMPALAEDGEGAFLYNYMLNNEEGYADCFMVAVEGNKEAAYTAKLAKLGFYVPATATDYGFECLDNEEEPMFEADVFFEEEYGMTSVSIYYYPDFSKGKEVIDTWAEVQTMFNSWSAALSLPGLTLPALAEDAPGAFYVSSSVDEEDFVVMVAENVVEAYLAKLEAAGWYVPAEEGDYGYECLDNLANPNYSLAIFGYALEGEVLTIMDIMPYVDDDDPTAPYEAYDYCDTWADVMDYVDVWCQRKGLENSPVIPALGVDAAEAFFVFISLNDPEGYYDEIQISYEGDVVEQYLAKLEEAGYDVPSTPDPEYGYECVDANEEFEIDVSYDEDYDATFLCVYSYLDFLA